MSRRIPNPNNSHSVEEEDNVALTSLTLMFLFLPLCLVKWSSSDKIPIIRYVHGDFVPVTIVIVLLKIFTAHVL
jgi:hypothetical protein